MQTTNIQNPALVSSVGTSIVQLVAAPAGGTGRIVSALTFANKSGAEITVQCSIFNGATDFFLAFNARIGVGDTLVLGGGNLKVQLTNGFSIRGLCNTAAACDFTASYTDFT